MTTSIISQLCIFPYQPFQLCFWLFSCQNELWSIDLCIVTKDSGGNWQRLIHEKTGFAQYDRYFWNTTPNSKDYSYKAAKIKECPGWWNEVRNSYLRIKNHYLQSHDYNHPSFVCYIEAVNEIYNKIGCRK